MIQSTFLVNSNVSLERRQVLYQKRDMQNLFVETLNASTKTKMLSSPHSLKRICEVTYVCELKMDFISFDLS